MAQWFYSRQGQKFGPVNSAELKRLAESGELRQTDSLWKEGMKEWAPAVNLKGLFPAASPPPPPLPLPATPPTLSDSPVAVVLQKATALWKALGTPAKIAIGVGAAVILLFPVVLILATTGEPEKKKRPPGWTETKVTQANFLKLREGMTLSEVEAIIGRGSKLGGKTRPDGKSHDLHIWTDGPREIAVMIEDGKVRSFQEKGLIPRSNEESKRNDGKGSGGGNDAAQFWKNVMDAAERMDKRDNPTNDPVIDAMLRSGAIMRK